MKAVGCRLKPEGHVCQSRDHATWMLQCPLGANLLMSCFSAVHFNTTRACNFETTRTLQALDRAVRRVLVEGGKAFLKVSKVFAEMELKVCRFENDRPGRRLRNLMKRLNMQASSQGSREAKCSTRCSGHCIEMSWQSAAGREVARNKGEKREKQP